MNILLAEKLFKPEHKDYLGFPGWNPNIAIVNDKDAADYVWYCCMGDGDEVCRDLSRAQGFDKPVISVTLGDRDYTPDISVTSRMIHFSTASKDPDRCVPYLYKPCDRPEVKRVVLASFAGSFSTNTGRKMLLDVASRDVIVEQREWWDLSDLERPRHRDRYHELMDSSKFSLCPSGFGMSSMRLADAIMSGSIPIMVGDKTKLFGQDLGEFALWSGFNVDDIRYAIDVARKMEEGEYYRRLIRMACFRNLFMLADERAGCTGTLGYTEYIRKMAGFK